MLSCALQDEILTVLLDRPPQRNAMSAALVAALIGIVAEFAENDEARVLILAGAGTGFCAGSDLGGLADMPDEVRRHFEAESGRLARMLGAVDKPVIAAVHGFAIGGGLTLAIAADIVVTEAAARWSLPEVPIGLFPAWGLGPLIRRAGQANARRLAWGIDQIDGREAHRLGLADIVAEGAVLDTANAVARRLAALPLPQARAVKHYFATVDGDGISDEAANRAFMAACAEPEAQASFARYAAKSG
jgi:enoyl-CoA hydratase/carnithine racemase